MIDQTKMDEATFDIVCDPWLILVRGVPGSGKTTIGHLLSVAKAGINDIDPGDCWPVIAADDYFTDEDGNYNWDPSKISEAHAQCKERVEDEMKIKQLRIFVTNTSTQEKEVKPYMDLAEKYGYKVASIIAENRHGNSNVHSVPDEVLEKMRNRFSVKL